MQVMIAKSNRGLSLVEVVIATAIILSAVVTLLGVHTLYLKTALSHGHAVKATYLAEEGIEVMHFLRDSSWTTNLSPLVSNTDYGLVLSGNNWQTSTTNLWVGNFRRTVVLTAVYRDASGDIASTGGTLDPDTLLVTTSVSWPTAGATTTKSLSTYLTNLHKN